MNFYHGSKSGEIRELTTDENIKVIKKEVINDAYKELLNYETMGEFKILRYEKLPVAERKRHYRELKNYIKTLTKEEVEDPNKFWKLFLEEGN